MGARVVVLRSLARAAALVLWTLVLWGALLLGLALVDGPRVGFGTALGRLLPSRGDSAWAWANAASAALACAAGVAAGIAAGGTWLRGRKHPPTP
jgi:hypothetical protein